MKPLRHPLMPVGHGRTPAVQLLLDERAKLLIAAAQFYPGASDREVARRLRMALTVYRDGRWRRDRAELTCPVQHRGLTALLWIDPQGPRSCPVRNDDPPRAG